MLSSAKWANWARLVAVTASFSFMLTAIPQFFWNEIFSYVAFATGLIIYSIEYPYKGRGKGSADMVYQYIGFIPMAMSSFVARIVLYSMLAIPGFIYVPTMISSLTLLIAIFMYAIAQSRDERYPGTT